MHMSPQAITGHPSTALIADLTPFLGPVRAILLLYGSRRRPGDVAHFCERRVASVAFQGFQLAVCVVDIVHGAQHDISRGATGFWIPLIRQGRVVAIGAAPPAKLGLLPGGQTEDGINVTTQSPCVLKDVCGVG